MKLLFVAFLAATAYAVPPFLRNNPLLPDGRIVGGSPISISAVPWQVSLQYYGYHICGGTLISADYVVTAAHCTDEIPVQTLSVRAGTATRGSGGTVVEVAIVYQHTSYNSETIDYDISVLQLSSSLPLSSSIRAASLPLLNAVWPEGTPVLVTGWGRLDEESTALPSDLQGVTVQIVSQASCRSIYGTNGITDRMLCAGVPGGGKDACQGDSGSPLVVESTLVGLVSWGVGCARDGYPGVYSNVPNLRSFIRAVTGL